MSVTLVQGYTSPFTIIRRVCGFLNHRLGSGVTSPVTFGHFLGESVCQTPFSFEICDVLVQGRTSLATFEERVCAELHLRV